MRKKLTLLIISLVLSVLLSVSATLAWFFGTRESIDNILITTGTMAADIELWRGVDFDKDGLLDLDENKQPIYQNLTTANADGTSTTTAISISNLHVNEKVTFRIKVVNKGSYDGNLTLSINKITENGTTRGLLQQVMVVEALTNSAGNSIQSLNKPEEKIVDGSVVKTPIVLVGGAIPKKSEVNPTQNIGYFDFMFYIADISLLSVLQVDTPTMTTELYNSLMRDGSLFNKTVKISLISVELQQKI